jgi:hypothetical protein
MISEEIARREEWNRIIAWVKTPPSRPVATSLRGTANESITLGRRFLHL